MSDQPYTLSLSGDALKAFLELLGAELLQVQERLSQTIIEFVSKPVTPERTAQLEQSLGDVSKQALRDILQSTFNQLEDGSEPPKFVYSELGCYRRENRKTANRRVATSFGEIELRRYPYRFAHREQEPSIFPLELQLGLVEGATPDLANTIARAMADTGASQGRVLDMLKRDHHVSLGVERLRKITLAEAEAMAPLRHKFQVARLQQLLAEADASAGSRKPVMAVGRDGITVGNQPHGFFEVASVGTITVYDRKGKRLGTVYLARMPESLQVEMSRQLKQLIVDVLAGCDHPLPRLCYVTDAGENETAFFHNVLQHLRDPKNSQRRLKWTRIVDFYHAAERITTMATILFGKDAVAGIAWARRMRRHLKQPNGPNRVLRSASALANERRMSKQAQSEFDTAYNYIRSRTKFMQYASYSRLHLPIGSGVTEAACKTVFTQRLKLSGMRWKSKTAQAILDLRTILLSGIWQDVRAARLDALSPTTRIVAQTKDESRSLLNAA